MLRLEQANNQRRIERQNFTAFAALIAAPGALGAGVPLPARGDVHVSTSSVLAAVDALVTVNAVDYSAPAGAAGAVHRLGSFRSGATVAKASGAPGTVSVYVRDPAGALHKIAEG